MVIRMTKDARTPVGDLKKGTRILVADEVGEAVVAEGNAEVVDPKPAETKAPNKGK